MDAAVTVLGDLTGQTPASPQAAARADPLPWCPLPVGRISCHARLPGSQAFAFPCR